MRIRSCPRCGGALTFADYYWHSPTGHDIRCKSCYALVGYNGRHQVYLLAIYFLSIFAYIQFVFPVSFLPRLENYKVFGLAILAVCVPFIFHLLAPLEIKKR
jgi:hypothetical protein